MNLGNNICYNILKPAWKDNINVAAPEVSHSIFAHGNNILFYQTLDIVSIISAPIRNTAEEYYEVNYYEYYN